MAWTYCWWPCQAPNHLDLTVESTLDVIQGQARVWQGQVGGAVVGAKRPKGIELMQVLVRETEHPRAIDRGLRCLWRLAISCITMYYSCVWRVAMPCRPASTTCQVGQDSPVPHS